MRLLNSPLKLKLLNKNDKISIYNLIAKIIGGYSSMVRVIVCDTIGYGFKSH